MIIEVVDSTAGVTLHLNTVYVSYISQRDSNTGKWQIVLVNGNPHRVQHFLTDSLDVVSRIVESHEHNWVGQRRREIDAIKAHEDDS